MSTLTVDQIQYNGGTAFTLPTGAPTAGQFIKTDGSGALGWVDGLSKTKSADGSSIIYDKPPTPVSGKILGTDGNENLAWVTGGGDPMAIGTHTGWRLGDKVDFNSTIADFGGSVTASPDKAGTVYLKVPNSGTTATTSNIIAYYMRGIGINRAANSVRYRVEPVNHGNTNLMQNNTYQYVKGNNYQTGGHTSYPTATYIDVSNPYTNLDTGSSANDNTNGDFNSFNNWNITMKRQFFELFWYNAKHSPDYWLRLNGQYDTNSYRMYNYVSGGAGQNGSNSSATSDHAAGFKLYTTSSNFVEGTVELYYVLKDGV